jgi:hypothetical protein
MAAYFSFGDRSMRDNYVTQCKYLQRLPDSGKKEQASKVNEPLHPLIKGNAQELSVLRAVSVCCGTIFCWGCLLLNAI